ncbi:MAG: EamA family transporter [Armatimonadota bacterium]
MGKILSTPILMIMLNVLLGSTGQLFLKYGMSRMGSISGSHSVQSGLMYSLKAIFTPYVFSGLALYAVSALIWLRILKMVNLSFAYPMISLSYVLVVLLSALILKERVPLITIAGLVFICVGVSLIGAGYSQSSK